MKQHYSQNVLFSMARDLVNIIIRGKSSVEYQ